MLRIMQIEYDGKVSLGKGEFGSVFRGKYDDRQVAVKRVALNQVMNDGKEKALQQLNHPNVIKLYHSENDNNFKYFAMELCAASLDQLFLKSGDPRKYKGPALPPDLEVFIQLASGLEYIHSNDLVHRDIKPSNVLIFIDSKRDKVTMKWADFGLSKFVIEIGTGKKSEIKRTTNYFAPELLKKGKTENQKELGRGTIKSDVFAFALVIGYLVLKGQHVYGFNYFCILGYIWNKNLFKINSKIDRSHYARDLLIKMLEDDPNKRISSEVVVKELEIIKIEIAEKEKEFRGLFKKNNVDRNKIKLLIQNGIDVNGKEDNLGWNALHWLCWNNGSAEKLIDVNDVKSWCNPLHLSCSNNSNEKLINPMQFLIKNGIDVNEEDIFGNNALHLLCRFYSSEKIVNAIRVLIENGIDVNGKDKDERNALYWLCRYNSSEKLIDAIKLLIQNQIEVNEKDDLGWNALHCLCCNVTNEKIIEAIGFLIQSGIDVNGKNIIGSNALHLLCQYHSSGKFTNAIQLLIENGIDVNEKNNYGWNALHYLCRYNSSEKLIDAMEFLIQNGIDINEKNDDGKNALHWLCGKNKSEKLIDAMKLLIQNGIDVNGKDNDGRNALHLSCGFHHPSEKLNYVIQFLIQKGIDVNEKDNDGWNALHFLCQFNSSEKLITAIKLLIRNGIDVNGKDNDGRNALHLLCQFNSSEKIVDAIRLLMKHGIQSNGIDARSLLSENHYRNKPETIEEIVQLFDRASIST